MNILILSNAFTRENDNSRLRFQCTYFEQQGHQIEVYTEPWDPIRFEHEYPIYEVGERVTKYWKWLLLSIYSFVTNYKDRIFALRVLWRIRKKHFDVILCSTNSCFPLSAAMMISRVKHLPLHIDLIDVNELMTGYRSTWLHPLQKIQQLVYNRRRNRALAYAHSITTISPEHVRFVERFNQHVQLMYNSFDPSQFYAAKQDTTTFRINYIGRAYRTQNFDMILRLMDNLKAELPKAQWIFYSNDFNYNHIKHARPNICGLMPQQIIGDTMRQSAIILLLSDTEDNGIQNEQFYQAVGCEKPVLFTNTVKGPLPDLIRLTNAGVCASNLNECMNFIRQIYHQWETEGCTHQDVMHKEMFDAQVQTQLLEQTLQQLAQV